MLFQQTETPAHPLHPGTQQTGEIAPHPFYSKINQRGAIAGTSPEKSNHPKRRSGYTPPPPLDIPGHISPFSMTPSDRDSEAASNPAFLLWKEKAGETFSLTRQYMSHSGLQAGAGPRRSAQQPVTPAHPCTRDTRTSCPAHWTAACPKLQALRFSTARLMNTI